MKRYLKFSLAALILVNSFFVINNSAFAQVDFGGGSFSGGGAGGSWGEGAVTTAKCTILSATISPSTAKGSFDNGFYAEATRTQTPITITVNTKNCADGKTIIYTSLTQYDTLGRPTNGFATDLNLDPTKDVSINPNIAALDNKPYAVRAGSDSFKITLIPGEEMCNIAVGADCKFGVRIGTEPKKYLFISRDKTSGNLDYDCDGTCAIGPKPTFQKIESIPNPATSSTQCVITGATINPSTAVGVSDPNFWSKSIQENIPVLITVTTKGCNDEPKTPVYVSLTTGNTTTLINTTPGYRNVANLNNRPITSATDGFQIIFATPGLEGCDTDKICRHSVRVGLEPDKYVFSSRNKPNGNLDYACPSSGCSGSTWKLDTTTPIKQYTPPTGTRVNGAKGECNQDYALKARASIPVSTDPLCVKGTPIDIQSNTTNTYSGWSWTCQGEPGKNGGTAGDNVLCFVKSLASPTNPSDPKDPSNPDNPDNPSDPDESNFLPSNFLQNPFKTLDTFPKILKAVVDNIVLPIAVPFIGLMIIYSGILFVIAKRGGKVYTLEKAKQQLLYTLIGAVLVLGVWVIVNALEGTLSTLTSYNYHHDYQSLVINKRV